MSSMRERIRALTKEFQSNCTHPTTRIRDDFDYHKNEEWKEEVCEECGLILRKW